LTLSFVPPTKEQLEAVAAYLDVGGAELLVQYGIAMADVRDSFVQLVAAEGCSHVRVESDPTNAAHFQELVGRVLQNQTKPAPFAGTRDPGCLVISADPCDAEAAAAACILARKTKYVASALLKAGVCFLSDHMDAGIVSHCHTVANARALVVILSTGTLSSRHQLEIIAHAMGLHVKGQGPPIIPANMFGFSFPSANYYGQVLPLVWPEVSEDQARHIAALLRTSCCPYSTHASDQVLLAQTKAIFERIPPGQQRSAAAADPLTCPGGVFVSWAADRVTVEI